MSFTETIFKAEGITLVYVDPPLHKADMTPSPFYFLVTEGTHSYDLSKEEAVKLRDALDVVLVA